MFTLYQHFQHSLILSRADNVAGVSGVGRCRGRRGGGGQGVHGRGRGQRGREQGSIRNRMSLIDRQWLVDAYKAGDDCLGLAQHIDVNYNTAQYHSSLVV